VDAIRLLRRESAARLDHIHNLEKLIINRNNEVRAMIENNTLTSIRSDIAMRGICQPTYPYQIDLQCTDVCQTKQTTTTSNPNVCICTGKTRDSRHHDNLDAERGETPQDDTLSAGRTSN
jgi:hypothetical protein